MRATLALLLLPMLAVLFLAGSLLSGFSALLTPERTLAVLEESKALPTLYRYGLESFAKSPEGEEAEGPLGLDHAVLVGLIEATVPEAQVTAWLSTGIPAFYAWLDSNDPDLAVPLDLIGVKARLGPAVDAVLTERVATVAVCTVEETVALERGDTSFCRLPGESDERLLQRVRGSGAVERFVAKFPDMVTAPNFAPVGEALGTPSAPTELGEGSAALRRGRTVYQQRSALLASVWLIAGFLLLLQTLLHRSQYRRLLRWLGLTLVAMGVLPLLLGIVGASGGLELSTTGRLPENLPPEVRAALGRLVDAAVAEVLRLPLLFGALAVVTGVLGTVLSLLHPHPHLGARKDHDR